MPMTVRVSSSVSTTMVSKPSSFATRKACTTPTGSGKNGLSTWLGAEKVAAANALMLGGPGAKRPASSPRSESLGFSSRTRPMPGA